MIYQEQKNIAGKLSRLCFGGASLSGKSGGYGFGDIGESCAEELIKYAIERGITLFDTAPIYGFNESEIRLGKYLKTHDREKLHIITKGGITWHASRRVNLTNEPKVMQAMFESSLKHLQTEYVDTYMIHWPDKQIDIRYPLEVLSKAQHQGKIKHVGLCNTNSEDLAKAREVAKIDVLQSECNLFHNAFSTIETEEAFTLGWGTLDKGILSGLFNKERKFAKEDARSWAPWWKKSGWRKKVDLVNQYKKDHDIDMLALALQYSLNNCHSAICGFKSKEQLDALIAALQINYSSDEIENAKKNFSLN